MNPARSSLNTADCPPELLAFSRNQIEVGSKSFNFASLFFSEKEKRGAWLLYSWCRFCDDQIDNTKSADEARLALAKLEEQTRVAYHSSDVPVLPAFQGLQWVAREFSIPEKYPFDLLRGMRMDVDGGGFETLADLEDYCYCVAGVVGLMMCHVMGISRNEALSNAVALGSAMQLTNISRDVDQDWAMGRIYFPQQWLRERGIDPAQFGTPQNRAQWHLLAQELLLVADQRYWHGIKGLSFLSFRAALAVAIAGRVYRQIGVKVKALGAKAWDQRRYVNKLEKLGLAARASLSVGLRLTHRLWRPWKPIPIERVWGRDGGRNV